MHVLPRILLVVLAWLGQSLPLAAEDRPSSVVQENVPWIGVRVDETRLVDQHLASEMACCVAGLLTALQLGPAEFQAIVPRLGGNDTQERLRGLVKQAADLPSQSAPGEKLFTEKRGVLSDDIVVLANHLLTQHGVEPLRGTYLDVQEQESQEALLARAHRQFVHSLTAGVPVLTSIRSFAAKRASEESAILWEGIGAHVVLVVAVPSRLEPWQRAFPIRFADPWTGRLAEGLVRIEAVRGFKAARSLNAKEARWLDRGFLQVDAPTLSIGTADLPWHARSFLTMNYVCGRLPTP